ncbi:RNA polymerases m/15 kd subunit domain-containing protein [Sarocladium implicatum]|nr:RNA polymerases m/15 kd subunit domain-containing protein [Sarocladium implicatum]
MATPQSTMADGPATSTKEQILFRFCAECSNMLYPKENPETRQLHFTCRTCQHTQQAESTCVFRNFLSTEAGETAGVTTDVASDPTVSDCDSHLSPIMCLSCDAIIACDTCGVPDGDLIVQEKARDEDNLGMCQFKLPWENEDPFDEYDEERLDDDEGDHHASQTTVRGRSGSGSTSDAFSDDSMIVDL